MSQPWHFVLDLFLVAMALAGTIAFIVLDRPRYHVVLLAFIAIIWGIDLAFVASHSPQASALFDRWHNVFVVLTAAAVFVVLFTRPQRPP